MSPACEGNVHTEPSLSPGRISSGSAEPKEQGLLCSEEEQLLTESCLTLPCTCTGASLRLE